VASRSIRKRWPNEAELEPDRPEPKTYGSASGLRIRRVSTAVKSAGFYYSFHGKVIVTDTRGKLIGSAAYYGSPAAVARDILRTAYDNERTLRDFDSRAESYV